ncbi:hypothetical protein A33Q_0080 [Indibacter alkaliphilus LW1]|jgi:hypothetical protein|uniref:DUF2911 domain-containing protein n=1 Tax=Indibacter alkaliphilus (strain CCUG 57479 / KCTC 22604 / LW1) TaxID=1189612 RepID=S2E7L4_INDAL|nr:DUF2911 domain-containing protein [Indibacter alkaliphilus]EPA00607.1 hypothetical protein A33Q_0080 [Indibacter alkaliphilus LW1]
MNFKTLIPAIVASSLMMACNTEKSVQTQDLRSVEGISQLEQEHTLEKTSYADSVNAGLVEDTFKGSARREAKGSIGNADITVNYGSPGKRGRVIWNGLVSYDQVWVSGSHWATAIDFSEDVMIGDTEVPAGMYGFFTIPGREEWTLILNKNYDQHLADDYDQSEDVVRLTVSPEELEEEVQRLTYEVKIESGNHGAISLMWDKVKVSLPVRTE